MDIYFTDSSCGDGLDTVVVEWPALGLPSIEYNQNGTLSVYIKGTWLINDGKVLGSDRIVRWMD